MSTVSTTQPPTPPHTPAPQNAHNLQSNLAPIGIADPNLPLKKSSYDGKTSFSSRTPTASLLCKILLWQHTNISLHGQILHNTPSHPCWSLPTRSGRMERGVRLTFALSKWALNFLLKLKSWQPLCLCLCLRSSAFWWAFYESGVCGGGIILFYFFTP